MKRLKELRSMSDYTQESLAAELGVSQQTIARWESGKVEPNIKALRDIAVLFGTSVDDLVEMQKSKGKITTNQYLVGRRASNQDGFWGHLGLMHPGQNQSNWYPITTSESERLMRNLQADDESWVTVTTLNNRELAFDPSLLKKISLIDDNEDQIEDDWEVTWDGYQGHSPEIYRALELRLLDVCTDTEFLEEYSDAICSIVDGLIGKHQLSANWERLLTQTHVYHTDGTRTDLAIDPTDLANISYYSQLEVPKIFHARERSGGRYFFLPSSTILLIDMPLVKVEEGNREIEAETSD